MISAKTKKIYLTIEIGDVDGGSDYFATHESIEEAIDYNADAEIFEASIKSIGKFKKQTTIIPIVDKKIVKKKKSL